MALSAERREQILTVLRDDGRVIAAELPDRLGVSLDTVRRDLDELAATGLLRRVRGGALPPSPASPRFVDRTEADLPAKRAIASAAIERLVASGQVLALGGGTTVRELARRLPDDLRATVLTTAPDVAVALLDRPGLEVQLLGGPVNSDTRTVTGVEAIEALSQVRPDVCLLGACSVDADAGVTIQHADEARVERAMVAASARTAVLADSTKLGTAGPWVVGPVGALEILITDDGAEPGAVAAIEREGVEVVLAR
jgi:DeoR/GlpR family transcriptional regulator of sugar metabolism